MKRKQLQTCCLRSSRLDKYAVAAAERQNKEFKKAQHSYRVASLSSPVAPQEEKKGKKKDKKKKDKKKKDKKRKKDKKKAPVYPACRSDKVSVRPACQVLHGCSYVRTRRRREKRCLGWKQMHCHGLLLCASSSSRCGILSFPYSGCMDPSKYKSIVWSFLLHTPIFKGYCALRCPKPCRDRCSCEVRKSSSSSSSGSSSSSSSSGKGAEEPGDEQGRPEKVLLLQCALGGLSVSSSVERRIPIRRPNHRSDCALNAMLSASSLLRKGYPSGDAKKSQEAAAATWLIWSMPWAITVLVLGRVFSIPSYDFAA